MSHGNSVSCRCRTTISTLLLLSFAIKRCLIFIFARILRKYTFGNC
nr:MAG TPA: hypothetical protein [Caudoviricetes sp.]